MSETQETFRRSTGGRRDLRPRAPDRVDVVLAAVIGTAVAVGPFTPSSGIVSVAAGVLAGAGFLGWRLFRTPGREAADRLAPTSARTPIRAWLMVAAIVAPLIPTVVWLYQRWTISVWQNAHGLLIPLVMAYLGHKILRRDDDPEPASSAWGFALLGPGLALIALDATARTHYVSSIGLVLCIPGAALLLLGSRRTRLLALPLALAFFMIPVPNSVAADLYLKQTTAWAIPSVIGLFGVPALRENTLLILPNGNFIVADACSGFSTLYAAVGLSVILAALSRSLWRKVLILLAAWPLAVACNIVRVALLVTIANHYGLGLLETPLHPASGIAVFWVVVTVLFFISDREGVREALA